MHCNTSLVKMNVLLRVILLFFCWLAEMRFELDQTFIDTLNKLNLRWMRDRISRMWPRWVAAAKQFTTEGSLRRKHHVKKVAVIFESRVSRVEF